MAESQVELTVLVKFYSDVQRTILDPVHVASLLRQEGIAAESLIDEVSPGNRFTLSERTASIVRHVEGAVRANRLSFWAFIAVLERSGPPARDIAQKMRNTAVELGKLGEKSLPVSSTVSVQSMTSSTSTNRGHKRTTNYASKSDDEVSSLPTKKLKSSTESKSGGLSRSRVELSGLTPDGIKYLMEHQMIQGIEYLEMVTPAQLEAIFQGLKRNTTLRTLEVPSTSNISTLCDSLTVNNTLQDLQLRRVDDDAMELLSVALSINRSLHKLTLRGCTDTGAKHLATMLKENTTLQDLSFSNISDSGVLRLSEALKHNNSLTDLNLRYSKQITNTGAVTLSKMLLVNKSLKTLNLFGTSVDKEGAAALMKSLLHNQVLTWLGLPNKLGTYIKQHALYARVQHKMAPM